MLKQIIKAITPPVLINVAKNIIGENRFWGVKGYYKSYDEANKFLQSKGLGNYSSDVILKKVYDATNAVRKGEAVFERDSVLFDEKEYNYPLLANLLYVLSVYAKENTVNILDFGGSLGSTYFQNRDKLTGYDYKWHIVEQPNFVHLGKEKIPEIVFHNTVEEYKAEYSCDICLLSSVIQYFDEPYKWLERVINAGFKYVLIDRTLFNNQPGDRCAIQYVPVEVYDAQYPIWLLNKNNVIKMIQKAGYTLENQWKSFDLMPVKNELFSNEIILSEGMLFYIKKRKDSL